MGLLHICVLFLIFTEKSVGGGDAKCKYLTLTLGTHVFSIISLFFNILEIFLIKIFKFSFPSFLLKHPGECWQHFLFIPTLYHQIPDQCCPIECLKCDWCNWTTKSLIEVIVTNLNLGLNSHMWLPYWALQPWKKKLPKPGYFNTIRDRAAFLF